MADTATRLVPAGKCLSSQVRRERGTLLLLWHSVYVTCQWCKVCLAEGWMFGISRDMQPSCAQPSVQCITLRITHLTPLIPPRTPPLCSALPPFQGAPEQRHARC